MQKDGIKLPESIKKMKASGATSFYKDGRRSFDLAHKGEYVEQKQRPALRDARSITRKGERARPQERRRGGVGSRRRRARAHVQDEGEQHRSGRHHDALRKRPARGEGFPRAA